MAPKRGFTLIIRVYYKKAILYTGGFPGGQVVKNSLARAGDARDVGSISGSGRSPGGGNGNPLQSSCLENPMDRGAWWATVHGVTKNQTRLSDWECTPHAWIQVRDPKTSFLRREELLFILVLYLSLLFQSLCLILTTSHCLLLTKEISQTLCILHTTSLAPLTHQHLLNSQNR